MSHISVLKKEVLGYLDPKPNENFIDCTLGRAGHALSVLEKTGPKGKVLGLDWDEENIKEVKAKIPREFKERLVLRQGSFSDLKELAEKNGFCKVSGILMDLGLSSWQLEESGRGFSFLKNDSLDMRYSADNPLTAEKIVNYYSLPELSRIFRELGEEKYSEKIAEEIVKGRKENPIKSTFQLVGIVKKAIGQKGNKSKIHFATRIFQALRIAVNGELENIERALPQALDVLKKEGRITVISFHSLEDRKVKEFLKNKKEEGLINLLTKKPVIPGKEEIKINPRSRSAKMRAAQKK